MMRGNYRFWKQVQFHGMGIKSVFLVAEHGDLLGCTAEERSKLGNTWDVQNQNWQGRLCKIFSINGMIQEISNRTHWTDP